LGKEVASPDLVMDSGSADAVDGIYVSFKICNCNEQMR
jgi:hypothetical protein